MISRDTLFVVQTRQSYSHPYTIAILTPDKLIEKMQSFRLAKPVEAEILGPKVGRIMSGETDRAHVMDVSTGNEMTIQAVE